MLLFLFQAGKILLYYKGKTKDILIRFTAWCCILVSNWHSSLKLLFFTHVHLCTHYKNFSFMLGLLWYISLQHWHTIWVCVQVLPDPLPTQLFGKWAEADLSADLLPTWKVLVEFRVPIFWHYPAVAVVGIWELSQQIEDLSLCLSLCVSITLPFKQIGRLKNVSNYLFERHRETYRQAVRDVWFSNLFPKCPQ